MGGIKAAWDTPAAAQQPDSAIAINDDGMFSLRSLSFTLATVPITTHSASAEQILGMSSA